MRRNHCLGYLHPHNSPGRNVAVTAFVLVFFSPRDLHVYHKTSLHPWKKIHLTMLKFDFRTAANFMYNRAQAMKQNHPTSSSTCWSLPLSLTCRSNSFLTDAEFRSRLCVTTRCLLEPIIFGGSSSPVIITSALSTFYIFCTECTTRTKIVFTSVW